jgi:hypothetical protein
VTKPSAAWSSSRQPLRHLDATPPPITGFEGKAKRLVRLGRSLDRAIATYKPAKATLEEAMSAWRDALADLNRSGGGAGE